MNPVQNTFPAFSLFSAAVLPVRKGQTILQSKDRYIFTKLQHSATF